ncbi:MAG TPA: fused MFS/spermidine synthase [Thermoanaerobaculia bacterium]|jgi:spermidine synthase
MRVSEVRRLQAVVALSGGVLMSLEILGSRVLAPHYGSSVYVWGSLITTFLTALAFGYWLGGQLADRRPEPSAISLILACAAVLVLPSVEWAPELLVASAGFGWDSRWAALTTSLLLFLPPSLAMGMVSPFAVRIAVRRVDRVGSVAGGYSALSTAGSILGTLVTAFWLIPSFSVQHLLLGLAATLAFCALLLARGRPATATATLAAFTCGMAAYAGTPPGNLSGEQILLAKDTAYHHISVTQLDRMLYLRFDNLTQSILFLDRPHQTISGYAEQLLFPWALRPSIRRVCQIGLGGATFSREVARLVPDGEIDSVEIDPAVVGIAREFFLYRESSRVRTFVEDGRVFLLRPGEPYDLIVLDAFNSTGVPFHLLTREFFETVRKRLTPDGVFAANFFGSLMGKDARLFWSSYRTIRRQFGQVYVMNPELASGKKNPTGNIIVVATISADPVGPETLRRNVEALAARWKVPRLPGYLSAWLHSPEPPSGVPELTDRYAPVEALQHF